MKNSRKFVSILLTLTILLAFTFTNYNTVNAKSKNSERELASLESNYGEELNELIDGNIPFINAIEMMPNSVIEEGADAIVEWLQDNVEGEYKFSTDGENLIIDSNMEPFTFNDETPVGDVQALNVATCIGAIGTALVTGILPIAKITKIKNALKAVGGTSKFVKNLIDHYKFNRNRGWSRSKSYDEAFDRATDAFGPQIRTELGALFGLTAIYGACFAVNNSDTSSGYNLNIAKV